MPPKKGVIFLPQRRKELAKFANSLEPRF